MGAADALSRCGGVCSRGRRDADGSGGAVSGTELADGVRAAKKRSTKKSQSAVSRSSFVSYEQIAPRQRLWKR